MRWIALVLALVIPVAARAEGAWTALGDEIVARVRKSFYDAPRAEAWAEQHRGYAKPARDAAEFAALTRAALVELKASHTAYVPRSSPDHAALRSIFGMRPRVTSIGADIGELADGWFVRHVFVGSPAEHAGLVRGDRIASVDGKPFHPVASFAGRAGDHVHLRVEREAGKPAIELVVTPRQVEPREEWLAAQKAGTRVITRGPKRIGYQHLFSCAGEDHEEVLAEAFAGPLASADALVLDFRDGWGGCQTSFAG